MGAGAMFFLSQSPGLDEAPQHLSTSAPQRLSTNFFIFVNFTLFNCVLMLVLSGCGGRGVYNAPRPGSLSAAEGRDSRSSLPLIPSEGDLNLGQLAPGSQKSRAFWLTNQSAAPVKIVEIVTSCDCLNVELPERILAPGQKIEGRIKLDLRKELQFIGNLGIPVEGKGKKGETLFKMEVRVAVDNN